MEWNYKCPNCGSSRKIDWNMRGKETNCGGCEQSYIVPTPATDHNAYVESGSKIPDEIRDVVHQVKGKDCVIKNNDDHSSDMELDHKIARSKGGKTSVNNLQPMCQHHNGSKGDDDFKTWMQANSLTI